MNIVDGAVHKLKDSEVATFQGDLPEFPKDILMAAGRGAYEASLDGALPITSGSYVDQLQEDKFRHGEKFRERNTDDKEGEAIQNA